MTQGMRRLKMEAFDTEQQAFFDEKIKEKFTEAFGKAESKYKGEMETALASAGETHKKAIDTLTAELAEMRKSKGKEGGEDNTALLKRIEGLEAKNKTNSDKAIKGHLEGLAGKLNAVNPEQVATLVRLQTKTDDDGHLVVINASGAPRNNGEGNPMTAEELVADYLKENQHLVKASGNTGSGGQGNQEHDKGGKKIIKRGEYDKMLPAVQSEFIQKGGRVED